MIVMMVTMISTPNPPCPCAIPMQVIQGLSDNGQFGASVSNAGDFNGDGVDDIIVGAPWESPGQLTRAGVSYVIYGKAGGYASPLRVGDVSSSSNPLSSNSSANSSAYFAILGGAASDFSGSVVSGGSDINGDGLADVVIGAYMADASGVQDAGEAYIVYGSGMAGLSSISLDGLSSSGRGVTIRGGSILGFLGFSVASIGDFNNDSTCHILHSVTRA